MPSKPYIWLQQAVRHSIMPAKLTHSFINSFNPQYLLNTLQSVDFRRLKCYHQLKIPKFLFYIVVELLKSKMPCEFKHGSWGGEPNSGTLAPHRSLAICIFCTAELGRNKCGACVLGASWELPGLTHDLPAILPFRSGRRDSKSDLLRAGAELFVSLLPSSLPPSLPFSLLSHTPLSNSSLKLASRYCNSRALQNQLIFG